MTPIVPLNILRDLTLRMTVPPALEERIGGLLETPLPPLEGETAKSFVQRALAVVDDSVVFLDDEVRRINEGKFSAPDPNALRNRLLGEPKRQADQALNSLKQRLQNEKQEWARRVAKQLNDVQAGLDQQIDTMLTQQVEDKHTVTLILDPEWLRGYDAWRGETYSRWAAHLQSTLPGKTRKAMETDLQAIAQILGKPVSVADHPAPPFKMPGGRDNVKENKEKYEIPTAFEAFFDSFKERLNSVAMISGLIIIPVVGSLMHTASTEIRAAVMSSALVPIVAFSFFQGKKHRRKLREGNFDKAQERLKKALIQDAKVELDRWKLDAERYTSNYCGAASQVIATSLEGTISKHFEELEKRTGRDLASAQLDADRMMDQLQTARQMKTSLVQQLGLELKRRLADLSPRLSTP